MKEYLIGNLKLLFFRIKFYLLFFYTKFKSHDYQNYKLFKSIDNKKCITDLKSRGYSIVENYLNSEECELIKRNIDNSLEKRKKFVWIDDLNSDRRIYGFNHICELTKKIFFSRELLQVANGYINYKLDNIFTMANKVSFVEENYGSGGGWHRDGINPSIKSLIYIDDVKSNNGPLQIILHSNKFNNIFLDNRNMNKKNYLDIRFKNKEVTKIENFHGRLKEFNLKKGSLIIFDGCNIHRGKPVETGSRYAITNYYFPIGKMTQEKYPVRPQVFN